MVPQLYHIIMNIVTEHPFHCARL